MIDDQSCCAVVGLPQERGGLRLPESPRHSIGQYSGGNTAHIVGLNQKGEQQSTRESEMSRTVVLPPHEASFTKRQWLA